jgi:hypothetical protein
MIAGAEALTSEGHNPRRGGAVATAMLVYAFAVIMAGTTLPTPNRGGLGGLLFQSYPYSSGG